MGRGWVLASLLCACAPKASGPIPSSPVPPTPVADPTPDAPAPEKVAIDPAPPPEPEPEPPPATLTVDGWVLDPHDRAAPSVSLAGGERSDTALVAVARRMGAVLQCWAPVAGEGAGSTTLLLTGKRNIERTEAGAAQWSVRELSGASGPLAECVAGAIRPSLGASARLGLVVIQLRSSRSASPLEEPDPTRLVDGLPGVGCWQAQPVMCPKNPHLKIPCDRPPPKPTRCGDATMRSDAQWHLGLDRSTGKLVATDTRLLAGDGGPLWQTPLPAALGEAIGAEITTTDDESIPVTEVTKRVSNRASAGVMVAAFAGGLFSVDRRTGSLRAAWAAPPATKPPLPSRGYTYRIRVGNEECLTGGRDPWLVMSCNGRLLLFDGTTLAVFDEETHRLLGTRTLQPKHVSSRRRRETRGLDEAKLRTAGVALTIDVAPQEARRR